MFAKVFVFVVLAALVEAELVVDLEGQYKALTNLVCNEKDVNATECVEMAEQKFIRPHAYVCFPENVSFNESWSLNLIFVTDIFYRTASRTAKRPTPAQRLPAPCPCLFTMKCACTLTLRSTARTTRSRPRRTSTGHSFATRTTASSRPRSVSWPSTSPSTTTTRRWNPWLILSLWTWRK